MILLLHPRTFSALQVYLPASEAATLVSTSPSSVIPDVIETPSFVHVTDGVGYPVILQWRVTLSPTLAFTLTFTKPPSHTGGAEKECKLIEFKRKRQ